MLCPDKDEQLRPQEFVTSLELNWRTKLNRACPRKLPFELQRNDLPLQLKVQALLPFPTLGNKPRSNPNFLHSTVHTCRNVGAEWYNPVEKNCAYTLVGILALTSSDVTESGAALLHVGEPLMLGR